MPDSTNKNPFSNPDYGNDLVKERTETNPFLDPDYGVEKGRGIKGHVKDLGLSLASGVNAAVDSAIGIGDIYTGGHLGKVIDNTGVYQAGEGSKYWSDKKSAQSKAIDQQFNDAEGIVDKAKVAISNPSKIVNAVAESVPAMLAGGALGRGASVASKGLVSPVAAGAVGEGLIMAGGQASQIRQENHNNLLSDDQTAISAATGAAGSLFGFIGGKIAQKLGIADVHTAMAGGAVNAGLKDAAQTAAQQIKLSDIPKSMVMGAISEGLLEELPQSVSEQVLQNFALGKEWNDGLDDAIVMGTLAGMAMGGSFSGVGKTKQYLAQPSQNNADSATAESLNPDVSPSGPLGGGGPGNAALDQETRFGNASADQNTRTFTDNGQNIQQANFPYTAGQEPSKNFQPGEQTESQRMGLDPKAGPLSAAAATAVDSGISGNLTSAAKPLQETTALDGLSDFGYQPNLEFEQPAANESQPDGFQPIESIDADFGEIDHPLADWSKADANQRIQWAKDAGLNPIQQRHAVNTNWPKLSEDLREKITAAMPSYAVEPAFPADSSETAASVEQKNQLPFKQRIQDAHVNDPSQKMKLIQDEIATGRPRAEVLAEVSKAVKEISDFQTAIGKIEASEPNSGSDAPLSNGGSNVTKSFHTQPLDHGALNVPLSKRGNIDAQLDQYKKEQAALENEKREILKGNHADAQSTVKPMFEALSAEQIKIYANKAGIKPSEAKKELKSMAHWQPQKALKVFQALQELQSKQDESKTLPGTPSFVPLNTQEVQKLEQQLADAKSVPQKARLRKQIVALQKDNPIDQAAHEAATSIQNDLPAPTQAQIEAGNYKKGHIKVHGLEIAVENPRGSERRGTDPDGKEWAHKMSDHYGYIKRTTGADNEHIDTYVGHNPESEHVFIVDQMDQQTGGFDEHKVMLGFNSQEEAVNAYQSNFDKGWKVGPVRSMTKDEFKDWLENGNTQKPAGESPQQSKVSNEVTKSNPLEKTDSSSKTESLKIKIQSDSGLTHSIPAILMDQVHKLGDVVNDLASMKTDGVKTDVLYGKQLLAKIAKLNPDVHVHIVSDLGSIKDNTIRAGLVDGGYYVPAQNTSYIYPKSDAWESSVLELINHELVHTVTEYSLSHGVVSDQLLTELQQIREQIDAYRWENPEGLSENVKNRFAYLIGTNPDHETLAVGIAESEVRQALKSIIGESGLSQLDAIYNEISSNQVEQNEQREQGQNTGNGKSTSNGNLSEVESRAAERSRGLSQETGASQQYDGSTRTDQTDLSTGEKQQGLTDKSGDKKRFSRTENSAASSAVAQVREALVSRFGEKTIADLEAQGVLNIVQDQREGMTGNVEGWYENGKVTLVASNLDADSAVATFLHELGGHGGFQNLMNKDAYVDLMRQFERMVEQGNPAALEAKRLAERELQREVQLDEYLPYMITLASQMQTRNVAQKAAMKRFMDRLISAVKAWLYDKGIQLNLNENDVLALAERMVEKQSGISAVQRVKQQLQNTSTWMKAPNGQPTNLTEQQWLQVRTPAFKRWFGDWQNSPAQASRAMDKNGEPKIYYHGTAAEFNKFNRGGGLLGRGVYLTDDIATAEMYADVKSAGKTSGRIIPLFVNTKQTMQATEKTSRDQIERASASGRFDGIRHSFSDMDFLVAFNPNQVKHALNNDGSFDDKNEDIRFSRQFDAEQTLNALSNSIKALSMKSVKDHAGFKFTDLLGLGLQALGRRQLTEIYSKLLPPLTQYNDLAAQMDADKNDAGAKADELVRAWSKVKDEKPLAELMHESTLAQIDPSKPHESGDSVTKYKKLHAQYNALSPEAQKVYADTRDEYKDQLTNVKQAIKDRIVRASMSNEKKAELMQQMDDQFFKALKGVYFPLARFGKYVVIVRDKKGVVESVSRAETMAEAQKSRAELFEIFPDSTIDQVILDKEFNASRDAVGRGFMTNLFNELGNMGLDAARQVELQDVLGQLYLNSMPDLSWAKHGIHRKGTAGFSQDARRAFAQNMFHGASYLAKLRYSDLLSEQLDAMQKHASVSRKNDPAYDQPKAQRVINEMNLRHENLMNPKSNPLSSTLTSVGFIYYLGLSPAAAMVNLSQTALVAYPIMGAKWGFDKAGKELLKASNDFRKGVDFHKVKWEGTKTDLYKAVSADISKLLNKDEQKAYKDAVDRGVIDVTQAHDLAGIAQGEDSGVMWKMRPIMRAASTMFHSAERFNREVTFIAAYRLARNAGSSHDQAFDQAVDATYKGHFDYSSGNRPRVMQGNVAKVLLLFKQFCQNMIYTLSRQAYQSIKADSQAERLEARKALASVLVMHAAFAGVLGLPVVGMLLSAASWMGGDDDDPWDAEIALRNYLAEAFNPTISNLIMKGAPRALTPIDMSGRVGINNMLLPDVQEGLEGKRWAESAMAAALGPVAGIGTNVIKGAQEISEGHNMRGIETMLPVFLKNFAKTQRYADEGVQDKTGVSIMDEVSSMDLLVQGMGFSPSDIRTANEGKSAIYQLDRKLNERRGSLMTLWSRAKMMDDQDEMDSLWAEIQGFNEKNPSRRITRLNLNQSYRNRQRRIDRSEDGIYLSKNHQDAREAGRFAFGQ
ncbi:PLxRFG domain-containing protein [Acinetobacter entericus]|uniref:PLxRFG domain-containing protein n=1 Tax=Acinetobacter entericus TaxID=2989714 RepID=A0ABT3NEH6_9GAMM|nr:PLxRFG domain-containing protein [Acinetobacter entericus]MCW8037958.1 PLxRFG domain-containing protein [Acinetobacter entericus]